MIDRALTAKCSHRVAILCIYLNCSTEAGIKTLSVVKCFSKSTEGIKLKWAQIIGGGLLGKPHLVLSTKQFRSEFNMSQKYFSSCLFHVNVFMMT